MKNFQEFILEGFIDDFKKRFSKRMETVAIPFNPGNFFIDFDSDKYSKKFKFSPNAHKYYVNCIGEAKEREPSINSFKNKTYEIETKSSIGKVNSIEYRIRYEADGKNSEFGNLYSNLYINPGRKNRWYGTIDTECSEFVDFRLNFQSLKEMSEKNGLKIGEEMYVKDNKKVEILSEVKEVCIIMFKEGGIRHNYYSIEAHDGYEAFLTLYYKGVNGVWYNIYEITPMPKQNLKDVKISGLDILAQGLIDLKDEGKLDFHFFIERGSTGNFYKCVVDLNMDSKLFIEFSKDYEVMSNRLEDLGYEVDLLEMSRTKVVFTVKNKN